MVINDLLEKRGLTKYRLAVQAGIPHATLNDMQWENQIGKVFCRNGI